MRLDEIVAAANRIKGGIVETPCQESSALSKIGGCRVFSKREYLQKTGSFKERGARNALLVLSSEAQKRGVIAASAGNHALALAYHGRDLGIPVTVVMPVFAPLIKQTRCASYGAKVVLFGANIGEAKIEADRLAEEQGLSYIHGFDGAEVIAGQGTLGLEILQQVPDVDVIVVPVGGGGLIAGVGFAVKALKPSVKIIGVESVGSASFSVALRHGQPCPFGLSPTLADGLAVPTVGPHAFEIAKDVVDEVVQVDEESIALAILRVLELEKGVVEGAGATPLAALLSGKLSAFSGQNIVLCLCGGNIDPSVLGRVIELGLVQDGRLARFRAVISDRPGGLADFARVVAEVGASVKEVRHERAFAGADVSSVQVECIVETKNHDHIEQLVTALTSAGISLVD